MKRINTLGLIITLIMVIIGCEEVKDIAGQRNIGVIPVISDINPGIFDSKDLENSYVEFVVDEYPGTQIDKIIIVGSYKNNFERIKIAEVVSFPSTVRIFSSDVASKLGVNLSDITNGEVFTFELLSVANGVTTRSNAALSVSVACAFDKDLTIGSYHSICLDWPSEGDLTITADANDPSTIYVSGLAEIEGLDEDKGPLVMHINLATFKVIADETVIASDYFGYGSITYVGSGEYNSCDGSFTMNLEISVGAYGSQGIYKFDMKRNPN